jgi:hypothetical protein
MVRALDLSALELKKRLEVLQMRQLLAGGMQDRDLTEIPLRLLPDLKLVLGEDLGR